MAIYTHIGVGSDDLAKSTSFYDGVLGALGISNMGPLEDRAIMYGKDAPEFMVFKPANGEPASHANGGTISFAAESRDAVDAFHKAGLAAGGTCEGAPGRREFHPTAYGAYLRDLYGNKICAYCYAPA